MGSIAGEAPLEPTTYPRWIVDDQPTPRFPLWTRGNTGEVFPNVVSPLSGSIYADAPARAHRQSFIEFGLFSEAEVQRFGIVMSGVFGGYLYLNLSVGRLMGVRTPGMTIEMIDEQGYGVHDAPPYHRQRGDANVVASARLARWAVRALRTPNLVDLDAARRESDAWLAALPDPAGASDDELLAVVPSFKARIERCFLPLGLMTAVSGIGRGMLEQLLRRRTNGDPTQLVNRMTAGLGTIASAMPARRLWDLGRIVAADPALGSLFDDGVEEVVAKVLGASGAAVTGAAVTDGAAAAPSIAAFASSFGAFLRDHGHRGPDEYELASPSWEMRPQIALALIDRLRLAPAARDPHLAAQRLAADRVTAVDEAMTLVARPVRPFVRRALHATEVGSAGREQAKDVFVLELAGMKRVLHELMRRARERGGPPDTRDAFLVTGDELASFVASPSQHADVIAERRRQRDDRQARIPPFWFDKEMSDPSTWSLRATTQEPARSARPQVLRGLAVCPGVAEGRARVVLDPADPRGLDPDEILVAPLTDPAWTPLFLGAAGVVVDVGAQQSHAAIVARELGIPAVVSVTGASRTIIDGTWLRVDANRGEVHVLSPPAEAATNDGPS